MISSVAVAVDWMLSDTSRDVFAASLDNCRVTSAALVSVLAVASISVEADESEPINSPIMASNARVALSSVSARRILAPASFAAASSTAFFATSAFLKTCSVSAIWPISLGSP